MSILSTTPIGCASLEGLHHSLSYKSGHIPGSGEVGHPAEFIPSSSKEGGKSYKNCSSDLALIKFRFT